MYLFIAVSDASTDKRSVFLFRSKKLQAAK